MHKWDKEIRAFLDGKVVQYSYSNNRWWIVENIGKFDSDEFRFRIKPEKQEITQFYNFNIGSPEVLRDVWRRGTEVIWTIEDGKIVDVKLKKDKENDGWITWCGGHCPVDPYTRVDFKLRGGIEGSSTVYARDLTWNHCGSPSDIIAYKVIP